MNTFFIACLLLVNMSEPVAPSTNKKPDEPTTPVVTIHTSSKSKGYWVIHQPAGTSAKVLVCYYNECNVLVKREWRTVERVNISSSRIVRSLKRALNEAIKLQLEENWN